jgi:hypothetical protein
LSDDRTNGEAGNRFYVQVRYPRSHQWVTLSCEAARRDAARRAALAFPEVVNAGGEHAMQVRVVASADLRDRGGQAAIDRAHEDLLWHALGASAAP